MREDDRHHVRSVHLQGDELAHASVLAVTLDTLSVLNGYTASTLDEQDSEHEHSYQDHDLKQEHNQTASGVIQAGAKLLDECTRQTGNDTDQDDERYTVTYSTVGDTLAEPHDEHGARAEDDRRNDGEGVESYLHVLSGLRHLYGEVHEVRRTLEQQDSDGQITGYLIHLLTSRLALLLHLLEVRYCYRKQLDDDGRGDVGHDTQCEDRGIGECTTREHIQQSHQSAFRLSMKSSQGCRINTRQDDERSEAVDEHEQQRCQHTAAEIFDLPDITYCFYELHIKSLI